MVTFVVLCWALLLVPLTQANDDHSQHVYDKDMFTHSIELEPHFIMFFAPWCGFCKKLQPTWNGLADRYNVMTNPPAYLAKVDCSREADLCTQEGIEGYPTLKLFRPGQESILYEGQRDHAVLEQWMLEMTSWVPKDDHETEALPEQSEHEPLFTLNSTSFQKHIAKGHHFVKFYAPWCGHCKALAPTWEELALILKNSNIVTVAKIDCTQEVSLCRENGIKGYPTLIWFKNGKLLEHYRGRRDLESLKQYIQSQLHIEAAAETTEDEEDSSDNEDDGEAEQANMEEEEEEEEEEGGGGGNESNVVTLTSQNFDETVARGISFVKFFTPWCGYCKSLIGTWEELSMKKFPGLPHVNIAQLDCTSDKDLCSKFKVTGYPTLLLFVGGNMVAKFSGPRDLEDLHSFVLTHAKDEL
uniref:thioredoxin domain-containing protein 5 n=1 Tax=Myxine glutinosa TaxID=7769 RepID=UPI00358EC57A